MNLLSSLRNTLHPTNSNEAWTLLGVFLFIFLVWCIRSGDNKGKKPGIIKSSLIALLILAMINWVVEKIF